MKETILVVDDNPFERNLVVKALAAADPAYEIQVADSAEEALALIGTAPPSVVLMDCRLPSMSGLDALREIRRASPRLPVILCTAEDARDSILDALRSGATDYVVKDRNFQQVVPLAVEKALGLASLERERFSILERLKQSKDRYERLVIHANDIMFQADTSGRCLYVNAAVEAQLGHTAEEFYRDPTLAWRLLHPDDKPPVREALQRIAARGGEEAIELRLSPGGLETRWYSLDLRTTPPAGSPGSTVIQGIARDVTESRELARQLRKEKTQLEEANRQLLEVNRLKNEFVASVSHELRTPMNSIIGYTDCLLDGLDGVLLAEQSTSLAIIRKNAGQLLNLLNDILDLAKIEAGKMQLHIEEFDLFGLVKDVVAVVGPLVRNSEVTLQSDLPASLPVKADFDKLRRILLNLLSNAIKFTRTGHVKVTAQPSPNVAGALKIEVEDTGVGISEADLPVIFEDFRQANGSASRQFSGTGLGLSITKRLVDLHGGEIWVRSRLGVGTTFHVVLPILPEAEVDDSAAMDHADVEGAERPRIVLVADRDPDLPGIVKKVLAPEGYKIVGCSDGDEAFRLARDLAPLIVLLDAKLLRPNGIPLLDTLRVHDDTRQIPILLLTEEGADTAKGIGSGTQGSLGKPLDFVELLARVQAVETGDGRPNILIVDDEADVLELYEDMLHTNGYTDIRRVTSGAEALAQVRRRLPDLVILDLLMPGMDGFQTITALRQDPETRDVPIVVVTGRSLSTQEQSFLSKNVTKVVSKQAIERAMLVTGLRDLLAGVGLREL